MFTGIIEALGAVRRIEREQNNIHFTIESSISEELKIDQSLCHDGVCLTVVAVGPGSHQVTAIDETLRRTNLGQWREGSEVNLERSLPLGGRLDGHMVQGHVDAVVECLGVEDAGGSWRLTFRYELRPGHLLVDKGSICLNGVSLTVVEPQGDRFSVAIIPYTWEHTNFHRLQPGDRINVEFDIIGKYIARHLAHYAPGGA